MVGGSVRSRPLPPLAEGVLAFLAVIAGLVVLMASRALPDFLGAFLVGIVVGWASSRSATMLAALVGVGAFYPVALVTGVFPFLGDAWWVAAVAVVACVGIGFGIGRMGRSVLTR